MLVILGGIRTSAFLGGMLMHTWVIPQAFLSFPNCSVYPRGEKSPGKGRAKFLG